MLNLKDNILEGRVALITGGGRGFGEATGRLLADHGAAVILADLNFESAKEVAADINEKGGKARALEMNVADFPLIKDKVKEAHDFFGRIDILVNNAGITGSCKIEEVTFESWDRMMNIDLKSMFFISQAVYEYMKEQNYGRIVNMSSLAAQRGGRSSDISYAIAKAGVLNMSKGFALQGAQYNITCNALCPGNMLTPMGKSLSWSQKDPKTYIPLGRYGVADDVAYAVLFLASDMSSYITGDALKINGGLYM